MSFGGDHPAPGHGKVSPRCVPKLPAMAGLCPGASRLPAMARLRPDAFPKGPRTGKTPVRGNISPACIQIRLILARYARYVSEKPRRAPLGNAPRGHLAAKGAFSPSEALRSCAAHESCHPPVALPLRRGSCPSNRITGSPFDGLALAQGCPPQRPADTRHLPMPAACRARCSQRQAADGLRQRSSGAWPTVRPSPEGPPTTSSRRAGRYRNAAQS